MGIIGINYKEREMSQLELWANGESLHNKNENICCPDFSCCNEKMNTPIDERKRYLEAYKNGSWDVCEIYILSYLTKALSMEKKEVVSSRPLKHFEDDGAYAD